MSGLLDFLKTPEGQGLLSAAFTGMATANRGTPWNNMGKAGVGGLMGYSNALNRQDQMAENAMTNKIRQMQLAEAERKLAQEQRIRDLAQKSILTPQQQAIGQFGPTNEGAESIGQFKPKFDMDSFLPGLMAEAPLQALELQTKMAKDRTPKVVGNYLVDESGKVIFSPPPDPNKMSRRDELEFQSQLRKDEREFAARLAASNRPVEKPPAPDKPPVGYRFTATGDLERIPGGPADLKAQAEETRKADGATDVDVAISTLRDAYDRLEKGGGITSTSSGPLSNAAAAISSSGVGQGVGKVFGTQNQSARNDIAMARPALLAALMKATGMSAKQMDSNAELKLWLSTATDPTLDVESNRRALENIENKYLKIGGKQEKTVTRRGMYGGRPVVEYSDGSVEYAN